MRRISENILLHDLDVEEAPLVLIQLIHLPSRHCVLQHAVLFLVHNEEEQGLVDLPLCEFQDVPLHLQPTQLFRNQELVLVQGDAVLRLNCDGHHVRVPE